MKQTLKTQYVVEKDGLYYTTGFNEEILWLRDPFNMNSVFPNKEYATKLADEHNATVRKFRVTAEVEVE